MPRRKTADFRRHVSCRTCAPRRTPGAEKEGEPTPGTGASPDEAWARGKDGQLTRATSRRNNQCFWLPSVFCSMLQSIE